MDITIYEKKGINLILSMDEEEAWLIIEDFEEIKLFPAEDRSLENEDFEDMLTAFEILTKRLKSKLNDETKMELLCEFVESYGEHSETRVIYENEVSEYVDENGKVREEYEDEVFKVGEFWIYDRAQENFV